MSSVGARTGGIPSLVQGGSTGVVEREAQTEADAGLDLAHTLEHLLGGEQVDPAELVVVAPVAPRRAGRALLPPIRHRCLSFPAAGPHVDRANACTDRLVDFSGIGPGRPEPERLTGGQRRSLTGMACSEPSGVQARIMPSWEKEARSAPASVNTCPRTRDMPLPGLHALVVVEEPAVPAHRLVKRHRDGHHRRGEVLMSHRRTDPLVRTHGGRYGQVPHEVGDQRLGQCRLLGDSCVEEPSVEDGGPDLVGSFGSRTPTSRSSRPSMGIGARYGVPG